MKTIQDIFEEEAIDLDMLEERSEESSYWESCFKFVSEKWTTPLAKLSEKQESWIYRILEDMVEWRIEKR